MERLRWLKWIIALHWPGCHVWLATDSEDSFLSDSSELFRQKRTRKGLERADSTHYRAILSKCLLSIIRDWMPSCQEWDTYHRPLLEMPGPVFPAECLHRPVQLAWLDTRHKQHTLPVNAHTTSSLPKTVALQFGRTARHTKLFRSPILLPWRGVRRGPGLQRADGSKGHERLGEECLDRWQDRGGFCRVHCVWAGYIAFQRSTVHVRDVSIRRASHEYKSRHTYALLSHQSDFPLFF